MKKHLFFAAGLAVLSTSAFATKARVQALGQSSVYGGYYFSDTRTKFKNPAYVNDYSNYVLTEWGTGNSGTDLVNAPNAEGGFFRTSGNFSYGIYFGNESKGNQEIRGGVAGAAVSPGNAKFLSKDNVWTLFFGGDAGVQWGVSAEYAMAKNNQQTISPNANRKQSSFSLNAGALMGNFEVYTRLGIMDESKGATFSDDKWIRKFAPTLGAAYGWNNNTFFAEAEWDGSSYKGTSVGNAGQVKWDQGMYRVGWGRVHKVNDTARLFTDLSWIGNRQTVKQDGAALTLRSRTYNQQYIPVTFGFEADANSWLTLRGSVMHEVWGRDYGASNFAISNTSSREATRANATTVAAGATLNFGKLKVDGLVGTSGATRAPGAAANTNVGILALDTLMSRVAVHYWF